MSRDRAVVRALSEAGLCESIVSRRPLAGGCIARVEQVGLEDGRTVVVKMGAASAASWFDGEATGLRALRDTHTVVVPEPLGVAQVGDAAAIVMTWIEPGAADAGVWEVFGRQLAALHAVEVGDRYGFDHDNHLGASAQPNGWMEDWVAFTAERRLLHQAAIAREQGVLTVTEVERVEALCRRLDGYLPRRPKPALLHGDLWSGNALPGANGSVAVIDPAVHVGDGWADIAMMRLFGGFHPRCFDAYAEVVGQPEDVDARVGVYQLYHLLNHVNLFGRGYVAQAMSRLSHLGC